MVRTVRLAREEQVENIKPGPSTFVVELVTTPRTRIPAGGSLPHRAGCCDPGVKLKSEKLHTYQDISQRINCIPTIKLLSLVRAVKEPLELIFVNAF